MPRRFQIPLDAAVRVIAARLGVRSGDWLGVATPKWNLIAPAFLYPGIAPGTVALGSVKGNIGHLDAAAGVMGVIKTALMLKAREILPVANFR